MNKSHLSQLKKAFCLCIIIIPIVTYSQTNDYSILKNEFNLAGDRLQEVQYFLMESKLITYQLDGTRVGADIFRLHLKYIPALVSGEKEDQYTCVRFTIQLGDSLEVALPALENWTYVFKEGIDENGQVFGIDHSKFMNLLDERGKTISIGITYHIYNAFIDFHGFCDVFTEPTSGGGGIQDLSKIGEKIVHAAAFTEPPVNLGDDILEGSFFKNGQVTLEFKGLSVVNDRSCALFEYDSGESFFKMIMRPMSDMEIVTVGSSHYMGDIYKDLETNWIQKATLKEFVVSETALPMPPGKIDAVNERDILIRHVSQEEFLTN